MSKIKLQSYEVVAPVKGVNPQQINHSIYLPRVHIRLILLVFGHYRDSKLL